MTIECYFSSCPFHSFNTAKDDEGPYCYERNCKATPQQIAVWSANRAVELDSALLLQQSRTGAYNHEAIQSTNNIDEYEQALLDHRTAPLVLGLDRVW